MNENVKKEYLRRTRKLLETKLFSRNLINGINTWAVPVVKYLGSFLKWTREEIKQMDQRTWKLMTMNKALHPRDDVDILYTSRKERVRGLSALKTALTRRYNDSKTTWKNTKEEWLQLSETRQTTGWTIEWQQTGNKDGKKNNSIDVLSNKQHLTRENLNVTKKRKLWERNRIPPKSSP